VLPLGLHSATVPLCKSHHAEQTARQRAAGLLDPDILEAHPRELLQLYAIAVCIPGLLAAVVRHRGDELRAAAFEHDARNWVRFIAHAAQVTPGDFGLRPSWRLPTEPPAPATVEVTADGLPRQLLAAIAWVLGDVNPDPAFASLLAALGSGELPDRVPAAQPVTELLARGVAAALDAIDAQALGYPDADALAASARCQLERAAAVCGELFRALGAPVSASTAQQS
jgi:hypothetical protein